MKFFLNVKRRFYLKREKRVNIFLFFFDLWVIWRPELPVHACEPARDCHNRC